MPIYEYNCKKCGEDFELIVRSDAEIACPACGAKNVEKKFSSFAAHSGSDGGVPPCHRGGSCCDLGKCGSGCCGVE